MKSIVLAAILAMSLTSCTPRQSAMHELFCSTRFKSDITYGSKVRVFSGFYAGRSGTVTDQKYVFSQHGTCKTAGFTVHIFDTDIGGIDAEVAQYDLYKEKSDDGND